MEREVGLVSRSAADRVGEPRDRAGIGSRQAGDDLIDQRGSPFRFRRKPNERLANGSVGPSGRGGDGFVGRFAPWRAEADHRPDDLIFVKRIEP